MRTQHLNTFKITILLFLFARFVFYWSYRILAKKNLAHTRKLPTTNPWRGQTFLSNQITRSLDRYPLMVIGAVDGCLEMVGWIHKSLELMAPRTCFSGFFDYGDRVRPFLGLWDPVQMAQKWL